MKAIILASILLIGEIVVASPGIQKFEHPLIHVRGYGGIKSAPSWVGNSGYLPMTNNEDVARAFCRGRGFDDYDPAKLETTQMSAGGFMGTAVAVNAMLVGDTEPQFSTITSKSGRFFEEVISSVICIRN